MGVKVSYVDIDESIHFDAVGGQEEAINALKEFANSINYHKIYEHWNVEPKGGILLVGDPGVGKTLSVKALANECGATMIQLTYSEMASMFVDKPIENFRKVQAIAEEEAKVNHVVLFIDEIDSFLPARNSGAQNHESENRRVSTFLAWMDGGLIKRENITVIGATNRLDAIDPAAKRPGRFDIIVNFKPFTPKTLCDVLRIHVEKRITSKLDNTPLFEELDYNRFEKFFEKNLLSGAEVEEAVKRALHDRAKIHRDKIMGAFVDPSDASAKEISISLRAPQFHPGKVNTDNLLFSLSTILDTHKRKGQFGFEGRTNV